MPERQLDRLMWAQACEAMERAERLHRQFFHRAHATPCWEAPVDIFETEDTLTIVIALPGVDPDQVQVTLSAGVLIVSGERPLPRKWQMPGFTGWRSRTGIFSGGSSCRRRDSNSPAGISPMAA